MFLIFIFSSGELSLEGLVISYFGLLGPRRDAFTRAEEARRTGDERSAAAVAAAAAHVDGR